MADDRRKQNQGGKPQEKRENDRRGQGGFGRTGEEKVNQRKKTTSSSGPKKTQD